MNRIQEVLNRAGYDFQQVEANGRIYRGKSHPNDKRKSAWCVIHKNHLQESGEPFYIMNYGDWGSGTSLTYCTVQDSGMSTQDKRAHTSSIKKARKEADKETQRLRNEAAENAEKMWNEMNDKFIETDYLAKKKITELYGARVRTEEGRPPYLCIPMRTFSGKLRNLERIFNNGADKKGLFGGERNGLFHCIGEITQETKAVYLCEGFATGVAIHKSLNEPVLVCFNAGNLPYVAKEAKLQSPQTNFIICADNDKAGIEKGNEAATACNGKCIPNDGAGDYWDLWNEKGPETVKENILRINPLEVIEKPSLEYIVDTPYPDEFFAKGGRTKRLDTIENFRTLLQRLGVISRYNVIKKEKDLLIPGESFHQDKKANCQLTYIKSWCSRINMPKADVLNLIDKVCSENLYNPVMTWICHKEWDGVSRIGEFFDTIKAVGEESDPKIYALKHTLMSKWMLSAVGAACEPNGVSAHGILVLQGQQYSGKTMWFKKLAPKELNVLKDGLALDPENKDSTFQALSHWIVELGELDATFRKADIARLKAFITKDADIIRRPYMPEEYNYARKTVFFASVNEPKFLVDTTGNRRFWVIETESINHAHEIDMQQVWAEFYALYKVLGKECFYLTHDEMIALNDSNETFQEISPIEERIRSVFDWEDEGLRSNQSLTATEICLKIGIQNPSARDVQAAGRALRLLGKASRKTNGRLVYDVPGIREN